MAPRGVVWCGSCSFVLFSKCLLKETLVFRIKSAFFCHNFWDRFILPLLCVSTGYILWDQHFIFSLCRCSFHKTCWRLKSVVWQRKYRRKKWCYYIFQIVEYFNSTSFQFFTTKNSDFEIYSPPFNLENYRDHLHPCYNNYRSSRSSHLLPSKQ